MATSPTTAPATLVGFKVPDHRSPKPSAGDTGMPIRLAALVSVSDAVLAEEIPSAPASLGLSARIHRAAIVIGITALSSGTAVLVIAAFVAR